MMHVQTFPSTLAKADADALNRESGRHYTSVLVWHYRIYRHSGHWLSSSAAQRLKGSISATQHSCMRTVAMPPPATVLRHLHSGTAELARGGVPREKPPGYWRARSVTVSQRGQPSR